MGRNIFQSDNPQGMMRAVVAVVHEGKTPEEALEIYRSSEEKRPARARREAPIGQSSAG
jgi:putative autoinducer-2 (AI-2) aldolase